MSNNAQRQFELDLVKALLAMLLAQHFITSAEYEAMVKEHEKIV